MHGHSNDHYSNSSFGVSRHHGHSQAPVYAHRHHNSGLFHSPIETLCCGALLGLACFSPRFAYGCIVAIAAVVIIACLATLAMSVTAETLLSIFLVAMVVAGVAALCKQYGCCGTEQNQQTFQPAQI